MPRKREDPLDIERQIQRGILILLTRRKPSATTRQARAVSEYLALCRESRHRLAERG